MKRLYKNLKKYYYIETDVVVSMISGVKQQVVEYTVWYARFTTIPIFGLRYTVIYGLDFEKFADIKSANEFVKLQKLIYKTAIKSKYRK